jgi:D-alanyl-D-alanine carboxypeptidase
MAQGQQQRGGARRQPSQQRPRQGGQQSGQQSGQRVPQPRQGAQRPPAQRNGTQARHARPVQQPKRSKAPIVIALLVLLLVLVLGVVLFLTRCQGDKASGTAAETVEQSAAPQNAQDGSNASDSGDDADDKDSAADDKDSATNKKASSWELTLVNKTHPLPEDWEIELAEVADGKYVDARIAEQFTQMIDDCRAAGYDDVFVNQAYRSHEDQTDIWDDFYNGYLEEGYSEEEAKELTGESVAIPGTSEHELGLAADICSINFDEEYNAPIQTWLRENGHKYGFIQRYPSGKEDITGTKNENWHFRYVGVEAATEMYESGEVLEEYLDEV